MVVTVVRIPLKGEDYHPLSQCLHPSAHAMMVYNRHSHIDNVTVLGDL